tara:strand:- start:618 stop:782 length:165 start_codon:yes stop_codon:yes gene_type:complete
MALKIQKQERKTVDKKTRQGCSNNSKGMKKYRGQGGPRKRCRQSCKPGRRGAKK